MDLIALEESIWAKRKSKTLKLNMQGLARGDEGLMSCLKAPPGKVLVSVDQVAGEPTIISHFSQDEAYRYAAFDGVGKEPFYKNNTLYIDDMYLMGSSQWPIIGDKMRQAFEQDWDGKTFTQQWLDDSEVIKGALKKQFRSAAKAVVLAIGYGAGWRKVQTMLKELGFNVSAAEARGIHKAYWNTFPQVKAYAGYCTNMVKEKGAIINPFNYRLTPKPHKAFNAVIQSTASGLLDVVIAHFFDTCKYLTRDDKQGIIHDEIVFTCPEDKIPEIKHDFYESVAYLNDLLDWTLQVRFGFITGTDHSQIH